MTGHQYWKNDTGSSIVAPISAYSVNGTEYLAVVVGEAGNQQTPNLPAIYAKECAVCHGANLQGVSAPALTGPSFGRSHLNGAQLRTVVVQTMPLTAPGSLKPDEYAAVMATSKLRLRAAGRRRTAAISHRRTT